MKKYFFNILIIIILFFGIMSCHTDDTCRKPRTVTMGIGFYLDTINQVNGRLVVQKLTIDTLWAKGLTVDSLLYKKAGNLNAIKLPLNLFSEESRFQIRFNTVTDTLTIRHKNLNEFISLECGYIRTHKIDTAFSTGHFIDSVAVNNETVNTIYVENIQIHHNK